MKPNSIFSKFLNMQQANLYFASSKKFYSFEFDERRSQFAKMSPIPTPLQFMTFEEYKGSLEYWKKEMKEALKDIALPLPSSLFIQIPICPDFTMMQKRISKQALNEMNTLFLNLIEALAKPLQNNAIDVNIQKAAIKANLLLEKENWESKMYPREPSPYLFDNYEHYKSTLKKWSNVEPTEIFHPMEFIKTIGETITKNDAITKVEKTELKLPQKYETNPAFLEFKKASFDDQALIENRLNQLKKDLKINSNGNISYPVDNSSSSLLSDFSVPYEIPFTPEKLVLLVNKLYKMRLGSIVTCNYLRYYKYIVDPYNYTVFSNGPEINEISISSDVSNAQMLYVLEALKPDKYISFLQKELPFYLKQIHIIKSNRILNRLYVIIFHMLRTQPKMMSIFFTDSLTISNVTTLIIIFSYIQKPIYTITSPEILTNSHTSCLNNLLMFLLARQLTNILVKFLKIIKTDTDKKTKQQIVAQNEQWGQAILSTLNNQNSFTEITNSFSNPHPIHCLIFHLLCDCAIDKCNNHIMSLFKNIPFYVFLGRIYQNESCRDQFGSICSHIFRLPELGLMMFKSFFNDHTQFQFSSSQIIKSVIPSAEFLSILIRNYSAEKFKLSGENVYKLILKITQLASYSPTSAFTLIYAIIKLCVKLNANNQLNSQNFKTISITIREQISSLFFLQNLTADNLRALYRIMHMILLGCKSIVSETDSFLFKYVEEIIIPFMNIRSENKIDVTVASWEAYREFVLDSNAPFLKDNQQYKAKVSNGIILENLPPGATLQLLLLEVHISKKSMKTKLQNKKSLFSGIEKYDKLASSFKKPSVLLPEVYKLAEKGELQDFRKEVSVLKQLYP